MKRWYDRNELLSQHLEKLKNVPSAQREEIVKGILHLIREKAPSLLEDFVMDFPLDTYRRRWYDRDPYLWLVVNGLKYAEPPIIESVTEYLVAGLSGVSPAVRR